MKNNDSLILIGGFHEIIELCDINNIAIIGVFDQNNKSCTPYEIDYLGNDFDAEKLFHKYKNNKVVLIPDAPKSREKLMNIYSLIGYSFGNIISKNATISKNSTLGVGVIIQSNCNVSVNVKIGDFIKLNTSANVMHDVTIGDFSTIAPNSVLLGNVNIGKRCYIGSNATILPGIQVCSDVTIGAGSVVTKNITKPGTYIGSPAKELKKK